MTRPSLSRDRDFRALWCGESVSLVGRELTMLALPLTAITTLNASAGELGVLGAARYLPYLLVAVPVGLLVDRMRRRPLLITSDLAQAGLLALIPVLALLDALRMSHLLVVALLLGAFQVVFDLGYRAYLPRLVAPDRLTEANAKLSMSESAAQIGGPGLGGLLIGAVTAPIAIVGNVLALLFAAGALARIQRKEQRTQPARTRGTIAEAIEGFRYTFKNGYLRACAGEAATYNLFWTLVQTLLVLYAVKELRISASALGLLLAIGAAGALLGALLTDRVARRIGVGATIIAAAAISDLAPFVIPFAPSGTGPVFLVLGPAFFIQGIGMTGCNVHVYALRATVTPDDLLGRTNAAYQMLTHGVRPVGALLAGLLGETIGLQGALIVGALGLLTTLLWFWFSPVRSLDRMSTLSEQRSDQGPEATTPSVVPVAS